MRSLDEVEKSHILRVLDECGGNQTRAAEVLGIDRVTLHHKLKKYGWSLRLKQKSRNIVYLGPGEGCFMVSFVLSDKAFEAAKQAHLSKTVQDALANAPRYPEGNGLRLVIRRSADLPSRSCQTDYG